MKLTRGRKKAFLEALRRTGSVRAAARIATPGNRTVHGPHTTFREAMRRDPGFAAAAQEAMDDALGGLEAEAMRRAVEGYRRPIYQRGELVGYETVYSDNMLLTLLRARAPDTYSERRDVHVSGKVNHDHRLLTIEVSDLLLLSQVDRDSLVEVLDRLAEAKGERAPDDVHRIEPPEPLQVVGPAHD